jgi:phosphoglycolate phosphatase-like HAD superfamily hydrolase
MKSIYFLTFWLLVALFLCISCIQQRDPLPSWNETPIKDSIRAYVKTAVKIIPEKDRIAVFDMDGTIACETPLWFEMYAAVNGLNQQSAKDPGLLKCPEYQYARKLAVNPADSTVLNHWGKYIDSMVWKAYAGVDHEEYVDSARAYLLRTNDPKFNIALSDLFYQPMLELIRYLKDNKFTVYIVSGSVQGVIWSVCPQTIALDRSHLIGTRQMLVPVYDPADKKTLFVINKGIFPPKDDKDGKSMNIYAQIGKVPVFAFGNTTGDFGMFNLTSTSSYPHAEFLLNHNDSIREYAYQPWHGDALPGWQDTLKAHGWNQVDMAQSFRTVWKSE